MKNKKIMIVLILMITVLVAMMPLVKATNGNLIIIDEENTENTQNNTNTNNTNTDNTNTNTTNRNNEVVNENTTSNNVENQAENKLPQTGVAEETTLFLFIAVCVVSAIYAYIKIRNYRNI